MGFKSRLPPKLCLSHLGNQLCLSLSELQNLPILPHFCLPSPPQQHTVHLFPMAAITNDHKHGGFKQHRCTIPEVRSLTRISLG